MKKVLALLVGVAVVGAAWGGTWFFPLVPPVEAQSPTATRTFSAASVAPGGELTVTIAPSDYGSFASVTETLPDGFTYERSSLADNEVDVTGQTVIFTLFDLTEDSFTYTVTASSTAGNYDFSGVLRDSNREGSSVTGDSRITVVADATPEPSPTATRTFSAASVAPGGELTVTIAPSGYGSFGGVTETLPDGFTYERSSLADNEVDVTGQTVIFTLFEFTEDSFTYTVTASSTAGNYDFSGVLRDSSRGESSVTGDSRITVVADATPEPSPTATRTFSAASVAPGGELTVTIAPSGYGDFGDVTETLPDGFTYERSSLPDSEVDVTGQTVIFTLFEFTEDSFTYTVTASSTAGNYDFSGVLRDSSRDESSVTGDSRITVVADATPEPSPTATRTFSAASVAPGGELTVTIAPSGYGDFGDVTETLPDGFTYERSSLPDSEVDVTGQTVIFTLFEFTEDSFTYTVTASSTAGNYDFSGTLRDFERDDYPVGCPCRVTVRVAAPEPEPEPQGNRAPTFSTNTAARLVDENSAAGTNVGSPVTATDADGDRLTYSLTGTDAGSFTINSGGQIMVGTGTMLDFEDKPSYTVTVTATDGSASDTITVTITVDNVEDPGVVTITPDTTPQVGTELTASLEDQDGSVANLTWQWQKDDGQGSYTDIPGATMMSYTPVMADDGSRLQATAMYDDSFGEDKTAKGMTANAVGATDDIFSWRDYDYDRDGTLSEIEASIAVLDYLIRGDITRDEAIQVVTAYRENPLIVGHLNTVTGSLSYFGPEQNNGVELAALHVNQAGGVHGALMIIVTGDTATNPAQGVIAARALLDVEGAVAIVGALASGVTLAVAQSVTVPKQRLLISPASTSPAITVLEDDDFLFRTTVSDAAQGVVLARLAWDNGYETAGIMLINNAYGEGLADQFEETFASLGGRVTGRVPHEDSQPTYTSELEKATEGDPDVLLAISYPGQAEVYLRESLEGVYSDTFLFVDGTKSPEMMEVVGWDALEGMLGTAQGSPDSPSLREFQRSYAAVHGAPPEHPFIAENYDAAVLIALAAAKAGTTTDSVAIRDALRSIANPPGEAVGPGVEGIKKALMLIAEGKDINYEGAAGTVDFDENGDVTGYIEIWKVEGGEIKSTGRFELP